MTDLFERVTALGREGQIFAVATVVARRAPVSAHLGDRAIVFADGRIEVANARHAATLDGVEHSFCCARFVKDPHGFLQPGHD